MYSSSLCNIDPDQKEMDEICNAFLGPEVREKYVIKEKPKKVFNKKQLKASKKERQPEDSRAEAEDKLTHKCGINNALICKRTTPAPTTLSLPYATPSPTKGTAQPRNNPKKSLKPTEKSKLKSRRPSKKNSKPAKRNQISKSKRTKKEQPR